jgi:hypothetical protein
MKAQRDGMPAAKIPGVAPSEFMQRLTRDKSYKSWSKEYL